MTAYGEDNSTATETFDIAGSSTVISRVRERCTVGYTGPAFPVNAKER